MAYLDANATEPLRPEARTAALAAMDLVGNPSSVHAAGRGARPLLEEARARRSPTGSALGRRGRVHLRRHRGGRAGGRGTGRGARRVARGRRRLLVSATEHDAVRAAAAGAAVLPVDADGVADLEALARLLRRRAGAGLPDARQQRDGHDPAGGRGRRAVPSRRRAAARGCGAGGRAHPGRPARRWARTAWRCRRTSSAGRKGPGRCCWRRAGTIAPLIAGGGQERGRRGGTPALPAIAGFAAAAARPTGGCDAAGACATRSSERRSAGRGDRRWAAATGCPTPPASRCPACGPRPR